MINEIWKDIIGYEGIYQVSNLGNVKSLDRIIFNIGNGADCKKKGRILKPNTDSGGYLYVGLYNNNKKKSSSIKIHRLVALHFCEGYEEWKEVNHKDGVRVNNNSDNLEWVTRAENNRHRFTHLGMTIPSGEDNYVSKLKNEHIPIIMKLYQMGVSQKIIGKAFKVSQGTISNLINNKTYNEDKILEKGLAISVFDLTENPYA